jgi:hypothetical protein
VKDFKVALLLLAASPIAVRAQDAKALVSKSIENYDRAWRAGMQWGYTQKDVTARDGREEITTSEIVPLDGTPYERLISRNAQPLSPSEQRREDRKFEKERKARQAESPAVREARIAKYEKQRAFIGEIPDAYDFRLVGNENVAGRPAWVIALTPHPGFVPRTPRAEMLKHIEGKLWIDRQDLQWARADARVIDTISIGLLLARIGAGAHIAMEMNKVAPNLWLPSRMAIDGSARVLLFDKRSLNERLTFSGYHRGQAGPIESGNLR